MKYCWFAVFVNYSTTKVLPFTVPAVAWFKAWPSRRLLSPFQPCHPSPQSIWHYYGARSRVLYRCFDLKEPLNKSSRSWLPARSGYSQCSRHVLHTSGLICDTKARNPTSAMLITHSPGDVGQRSAIASFAGLLARGSDIDSTIRIVALRVSDREKSPLRPFLDGESYSEVPK